MAAIPLVPIHGGEFGSVVILKSLQLTYSGKHRGRDILHHVQP